MIEIGDVTLLMVRETGSSIHGERDGKQSRPIHGERETGSSIHGERDRKQYTWLERERETGSSIHGERDRKQYTWRERREAVYMVRELVRSHQKRIERPNHRKSIF